jgi:multimeric flavodoxin WrbA
MLLRDIRMSTVILSAATQELPSLYSLEALVRAELIGAGERDVRTFELSQLKLAYCQGEFDCWVTTPGVCRAHDTEEDIVRAIHDADSLILLDAVTFGGHSYAVKRAQDRMICLLTPFFVKRAALTHHDSRYAKQAKLYALGWLAEPDPEQTRTWLDLADANAVNMVAPCVGAAVVDEAHRADWAAQIRLMLGSHVHPGENIHARGPLLNALMEAARPASPTPPPRALQTAAFIVGSAKIKHTSVSEAIARAFAARLELEGMRTEIHFATEFVHASEKAIAAAHSIAAADLVVLAAPLYVDSLPALAVRALAMANDAKSTASNSRGDARFVAIVNCGFPEPEQTRTAMRIAKHFCSRAGYHWAGGLPLGGGGAIDPAKPLDDQHGPAEHVKRGLDVAAPALAHGEDIPELARELFAKSPLPDFAYRLIGDLGWRYQAYKHGLTQSALHGRPLDL